MKILFITSSRIGDAVLSTGLLDYMARTYPQGKVTIVCGPLATSLFEGYLLLERIIPLKKQSFNRHWLKLWAALGGQRWDLVVDLRNSVVSRLIPAGQRFIFGGQIDKSLHKVEQNAAVMNLSDVPAPKLWFTVAQKQKAEQIIPAGAPVLAVGPAANWPAKTWPVERFIEIIKWMTEEGGIVPGARVAVFAAPGEEKIARQVLNAVPSARQIDVIAKTDPGTAAACLSRCDFYLGNDSGLMHCAAATGIKTLGLFGPSYSHLYRPWGAQAAYVQTPQSFDELVDYEGYTPKTAPCLMEGLSVETVKKAIGDMLLMPQLGPSYSIL